MTTVRFAFSPYVLGIYCHPCSRIATIWTNRATHASSSPPAVLRELSSPCCASLINPLRLLHTTCATDLRATPAVRISAQFDALSHREYSRSLTRVILLHVRRADLWLLRGANLYKICLCAAQRSVVSGSLESSSGRLRPSRRNKFACSDSWTASPSARPALPGELCRADRSRAVLVAFPSVLSSKLNWTSHA